MTFLAIAATGTPATLDAFDRAVRVCGTPICQIHSVGRYRWTYSVHPDNLPAAVDAAKAAGVALEEVRSTRAGRNVTETARMLVDGRLGAVEGV